MKIVLGANIKAVNTDNGGELLAEFEKACQEMDITEPRATAFLNHTRIASSTPRCDIPLVEKP